MMDRREFLALGAAGLLLPSCVGRNKSVGGGSVRANGGIEWHRDAVTGVRWCVGVPYCERLVDEKYQTLGILVPAELADLPAAAHEAPVVVPVVTDGYAARAAPVESDISELIERARPFLEAGLIYVCAGCRGREHGAPAGVVDLKAAVRWLRAHDEDVPGNKDLIFAFGHSGGGAQAALLGASGNSGLWVPYLEAIGAADASDAVMGSMCWCPVTSLGAADAAYEWMMGRHCREGADLERSLEIAAIYPDYLGSLGYSEGEYVGLLLDVATTSLRNWLADGKGREVDASWDWIAWDASEPRVADLGGFARAHKRPDKPVPAFDRDGLGSPENMLFGHGGTPLHFDDGYVDACGLTVAERVALYDPLTYLLGNDGANAEADADVAPFWRVSSGIMQPDTALTTEVNLAESARRHSSVRDVLFQTVWDQGHVMAERSGTPEQNLIAWIGECVG